MIYRTAQPADAEQVALFHADSWRRTDRGLFSDEFLDNEADFNRRNVWHSRLTADRADQFVCIADAGGKVIGFVCAYGHEDDRWGSLIDNLHVAAAYQRCGIGAKLMEHAFTWLRAHFPADAVYLWVMERNSQARGCYEKLGASNSGVYDKPNPVGGGSALNCRYVWPEEVFRAKAR